MTPGRGSSKVAVKSVHKALEGFNQAEAERGKLAVRVPIITSEGASAALRRQKLSGLWSRKR